jgi:hypothetical protein
MRLTTQEEDIPSPLAISAVVQPSVAEVATSLTIAIPLGLTLFQSIDRGGVERDEAWAFAFVDADASVRVAELPAGAAESAALPVDDPSPERDRRVAAEPLVDLPRLVAEAELPALDEQPLSQVLGVGVAESEAGASDERRAEFLGVVKVVQSERHRSPGVSVVAPIVGIRLVAEHFMYDRFRQVLNA